MDWSFSFTLMNYGERWRKHRKAFHTHLGPTTVDQFQSVHMSNSRAFLKRLKDTPEDFMEHTRQCVSHWLLLYKELIGLAIVNL